MSGAEVVPALRSPTAHASEVYSSYGRRRRGRFGFRGADTGRPVRGEYQFAKIKDAKFVEFLVASVIPTRPNVVSKAAILKTVFDAIGSRPRGGVHYLSVNFMDVVNATYDLVALEGSGEGRLYAVRSPNFVPTMCSRWIRSRSAQGLG
jgi:hypothetical protein